jgi:tetratricopeptide (TPR) repeat protein
MISLKAYIREIEKLIDQGLYQEAITHCKHILSKYPKYVDVYRNLGKALLELKRYKESEDIFFRVLSVYPDDFISHAGLSIIAEEQNNLDLAIWHMELAFDVQPSNLAIQDELKRLFRLRDGILQSKSG